jgi:hypothetical protein
VLGKEKGQLEFGSHMTSPNVPTAVSTFTGRQSMTSHLAMNARIRNSSVDSAAKGARS